MAWKRRDSELPIPKKAKAEESKPDSKPEVRKRAALTQKVVRNRVDVTQKVARSRAAAVDRVVAANRVDVTRKAVQNRDSELQTRFLKKAKAEESKPEVRKSPNLEQAAARNPKALIIRKKN